jgi:hypothetical protein
MSMPKLIVYAYGDNAANSADMLLQFVQFNAFNQLHDRLLIVCGFNGERPMQLDDIRARIKQTIVQKFSPLGVHIDFNSANSNADLLMVNFHNIERIYALVYAKINSLWVQYALDEFFGCIGDGHPQVVLAMTQACQQFPDTTIWFSHGTQYRTMTQLVHDTTAGAAPTDLPRNMMYDYKLSANMYHDMHQFIEQINTLVRTHEYDAARTSLRAKYQQIRLTAVLHTIRNQWFALSDGLRYWHNFMHAQALSYFEALIHHSAAGMTTADRQGVSRIRTRLDVMSKQYNFLERIANLKFNRELEQHVKDEIRQYKNWLHTNNYHGYELAIDKYNNAMRCIDQGRYDDAIVRLNSVLEMLAAIRLLLNYDVVTMNMREQEMNVLLSKPASAYDGIVNLSRRDLYRILKGKNERDRLWSVYYDLGGNAPAHIDTPLEVAIRKRHKSYLVHGNSVISLNDCHQLAGFVLRLIEAAVGGPVDVDSYAIPNFELIIQFDADGQIVPMGWRV